MSKKHSRPGYVPQQRQLGYRQIAPVTHVEVVGVGADSEEIVTQEVAPALAGYEELFDVMEFDEGLPSDDPQNMPGILFAENLGYLIESDEIPNEEDYKIAALATAKYLTNGAIFLRENFGVDIVADSSSLTMLNNGTKSDIYRELFSRQARLYKNGEDYETQRACGAAGWLFLAFAGRRLGTPERINEDMGSANLKTLGMINDMGHDLPEAYDIDEATDYRRNLANQISKNPAGFRRSNHRLLQRLMAPGLIEFVDSKIESYERANDSTWSQGETNQKEFSILGDLVAMPEINGGQIVDYSILPPGTDLVEYTRAICEGVSEADKPYVDLKRVAILEKLRDQLGEDNTYYVHGKPRGNMLDENGEPINEAYIGLVIQNHNAYGQVRGEDVIVVSPIAKRHAGYVVRYDALESGTSWRKVLALPKKIAQEQGARQLKFTQVAGMDKYDAYVAKAMELLTCPPESFAPEFELRQNKSGEYVLRKRQKRAISEIFPA